jgi:hypothetical protein
LERKSHDTEAAKRFKFKRVHENIGNQFLSLTYDEFGNVQNCMTQFEPFVFEGLEAPDINYDTLEREMKISNINRMKLATESNKRAYLERLDVARRYKTSYLERMEAMQTALQGMQFLEPDNEPGTRTRISLGEHLQYWSTHETYQALANYVLAMQASRGSDVQTLRNMVRTDPKLKTAFDNFKDELKTLPGVRMQLDLLNELNKLTQSRTKDVPRMPTLGELAMQAIIRNPNCSMLDRHARNMAGEAAQKRNEKRPRDDGS